MDIVHHIFYLGDPAGTRKNPVSGEAKVGALKGVRLVRFKVHAPLLLLAYQFVERANRIEVLDAGPHETFYRDLQKYLDAREGRVPRRHSPPSEASPF